MGVPTALLGLPAVLSGQGKSLANQDGSYIAFTDSQSGESAPIAVSAMTADLDPPGAQQFGEPLLGPKGQPQFGLASRAKALRASMFKIRIRSPRTSMVSPSMITMRRPSTVSAMAGRGAVPSDRATSTNLRNFNSSRLRLV